MRGLHYMEALMYRAMLQGAWGLKTAPLIPNDPQTLRGLSGVPEAIWKKHGAAVMGMFDLSQDGKFYSHERLTADWKEAVALMKKNIKRASKGGKAKQRKRLEASTKSASSTPQAAPRVLEPAYNSTEHNSTEQERETDAQAIPPLQLAQKVAAEVCLQGHGIIAAISGAIEFLVKHEGKSNNSAVEFLIAMARDEIDRGGAPDRFWFESRKWRKAQETSNGTRNTGEKARNRAASFGGFEDVVG